MTTVATTAGPSLGSGWARRLVRRSAWLMLGAAIGTAAVIAALGVASIWTAEPPIWLLVVVLVLAVAGLGLVPGARELEVTAARTMLGSRAELLTPARPRAAHRLQSMVWVLVHVIAGLGAGFALFGLAPGALFVLVRMAAGDGAPSLGLPAPGTAVSRALGTGAATIAFLACLAAFWAAGLAAQMVVGRVLGPTDGDRLAVAEARIAREAEHTRLARELHDGIGHALTIVGVQAAAGRRALRHVSGRDQAAEALVAIEDTARSALAELDGLLRLLRDDRPADAGSVRLRDVMAAHRRAGLDIEESVALPDDCPELLDKTLQRIVGEALTNAHRHAAAGPVRLRVETADSAVTVTVTSPLEGRPRRRRGGRGLAGVAERATLFGGTAEAGPDGDRWRLRAVLPLPSGRGGDVAVTDPTRSADD